MTKKTISILLIASMLIAIFPVIGFAVIAEPTITNIQVNHQFKVDFDTYIIDNNKYVKLRDLAYTLNGTEKQFAVGWDSAKNAISLTSGQPYEAVGGEMTIKGSGPKEAAKTDSTVFLNGSQVRLTAYKIDNNNYFRLRHIGTQWKIFGKLIRHRVIRW